MRILAIDPALRNTGYAVVEGDHRRACALDYGTLSIPRSVSQSGCLLAIQPVSYTHLDVYKRQLL